MAPPKQQNRLHELLQRSVLESGTMMWGAEMILIVDDDVIWYRTLSGALQRGGASKPAHAEDLDRGLSLACECQPSAIVLDVMLGDESSIDAIHSFRLAAPEAHILVVTSGPRPSDQVVAIAEGADEYMHKLDWRAIVGSVLSAAIHPTAA